MPAEHEDQYTWYSSARASNGGHQMPSFYDDARLRSAYVDRPAVRTDEAVPHTSGISQYREPADTGRQHQAATSGGGHHDFAGTWQRDDIGQQRSVDSSLPTEHRRPDSRRPSHDVTSSDLDTIERHGSSAYAALGNGYNWAAAAAAAATWNRGSEAATPNWNQDDEAGTYNWESDSEASWREQEMADLRRKDEGHDVAPGQVPEAAYAKLGRRPDPGNGFVVGVPSGRNYENFPDAGPIRRGFERQHQGKDADLPSNKEQLFTRPSEEAWHAGVLGGQPTSAYAAIARPAAPRHGTPMRADGHGYESSSGQSEDGRAPGGAANNHWQEPGRAAGINHQDEDQLGGGSYRSFNSNSVSERGWQLNPRVFAQQQAEHLSPLSNGDHQAADVNSVMTGASEIIGPPGYGQLYENNFLNGRLQQQAALMGSKMSLDSHSQDTQWRSPDLSELIDLLSQSNTAVAKNAAAYLQHLCYNNNGTKAKARSLGGIRALVELLHSCDTIDVQRAACGCLLNLTRGRENDDGKRELRDCNGIEALARLLRRGADNDVRELATGILWNLSSSKALKRPVIDASLTVLVNMVIIPHSGWDPRRPSDDERPANVYWSTVFRNASGTLRNVSSDGYYARKKLRECAGLVESLLCIVKAAIGKNDIDNKSVENCVCILRNLSYRLMEIDYPDYYDKEAEAARRPTPAPSPALSILPGCLQSASKKKSDTDAASKSKYPSRTPLGSGRGELLWQPDVVYVYLPLLADCSNPDTLEAAIGSLQNLTACEWQPAYELREKVRKEKGLPIIVELLGLEADSVVCAAVIALRNLAADTRNKELIGKYAIQQLLAKLPPRVPSMREQRFSEQTVCAVIATLQVIIKDSVEHASTIANEGDGIARLMTIAKSQGKYEARTLICTRQLLSTLWKFSVLRSVYKKKGWKEIDFTSKAMHPRSVSGSQASLSSGQVLRQARADDARSDVSSLPGLPARSHTAPPPSRSSGAHPADGGVRGALAGKLGSGMHHSKVVSMPTAHHETGVDFARKQQRTGYQAADNYAWLSSADDTSTTPSPVPPYAQESRVDLHPRTTTSDRLDMRVEPLYAKVDRQKKLQRHSNGDQQQPFAGSTHVDSLRLLTLAKSTDSEIAAADSWV